MISKSTAIERIIMVRINPGEDVLLGIRNAVYENKLKTAVIMSGFGSVKKSHFHVVMNAELPPAESYPQSEQALDVCSFNGMVIDGRVHAHVTYSDERNAFGGHLEEGNIALTFVMITLGELADISVDKWDSYTEENELAP